MSHEWNPEEAVWTASAIIAHCPLCQQSWDIDRDPGQCKCDGDVDSEQEMFVVSTAQNGLLKSARCDDLPLVCANGLTRDAAVRNWVLAFKS